MPHLIIEYVEHLADEEKLPAMIDAVHAAAKSSGLFDERDIKTRLIPLTHYRAGAAGESFIHVELRLLDGRNAAQKKQLAEGVLKAVLEQGWNPDQASVEIVDMERESYAKYWV